MNRFAVAAAASLVSSGTVVVPGSTGGNGTGSTGGNGTGKHRRRRDDLAQASDAPVSESDGAPVGATADERAGRRRHRRRGAEAAHG
jgi:hypothetical protein